MFLKKLFMVAAPEGAGSASGGGVPAASPAGAANPAPAAGAAPAEPRVPFVLPSDDGSEGGVQPSRQPGQAAPAIPAGQGTDNPIPYQRVREMIAKRDQFYEKKFNELLQHVGQPQQRQMPDPKQLLRAMGYEIPEEQPQFASIPDVQRYVQEQLGQFQQQTQQAMYVRHEYDDARADLQQLKSQYPQYFEGELASQVEATLGHLWGSQDDLPMREVGKTFFALLERAADARNASYARTKANDGRAVPIRQVGSGVQVTAGKQIDLATEGGIDEAMDALLAQQAG